MICVKVITNPVAVSASKVRPITSISLPAISEAERRKSYFWSKPRQEENQSLAADICTVILFGQIVASTQWQFWFQGGKAPTLWLPVPAPSTPGLIHLETHQTTTTDTCGWICHKGVLWKIIRGSEKCNNFAITINNWGHFLVSSNSGKYPRLSGGRPRFDSPTETLYFGAVVASW